MIKQNDLQLPNVESCYFNVKKVRKDGYRWMDTSSTGILVLNLEKNMLNIAIESNENYDHNIYLAITAHYIANLFFLRISKFTDIKDIYFSENS